ncbi:unnamed protein product [Brassica napus]|uniref:(rape) hypothetical protein n=1 Tax=Brassica napus TaxID=3708 RepID=A0A816R9N2_BRANA|nr:unnamed protein product [Brassica napus]
MADMAACIRQSAWFRPRTSQVYKLFFLVEVDPDNICPRIEDIEGNCKVDGLKACEKYMSTTYNSNYFNCTCDNVYMIHKIKRYCRCNSICPDAPPPPIQPR